MFVDTSTTILFLRPLLSSSPWACAIGFALGMGLLAAPELAHSQTTYVVDDTADVGDVEPGDGVCDASGELTSCTLRAAIEEANANAATTDEVIEFGNIATSQEPARIDLANGPLVVSDTVTIDGTTENNYTGEAPTVLIDGSSLADPADNFQIQVGATGSTVQALAVVGAPRNGFEVDSGVVIQDCYVGILPDGITPNGNEFSGILTSGNDNLIQANIISGNGGSGITLSGSDNVVSGNLIGIGADGTTEVGNGSGVEAFGPNNFIGFCSPGCVGNTISGNDGAGISLSDDGQSVVANRIGTDESGTSAVPNGTGVEVESNNNIVGGSEDGRRNVISGNESDGILIDGVELQTADNNIIENNFIGTNASGTGAIPNGTQSAEDGGIRFGGGVDNSVVDNFIAGNESHGILVGGASPSNVIRGNRIGVGANGDPLGNSLRGVWVQTDSNTIGGGSTGEENVVGSNSFSGILIEGNSNAVDSNFVGVTASGSNVGNEANGIAVVGGDGNVLDGNTVGFNGSAGVLLRATSDNGIRNNRIGIDATGDAAPNEGNGVSIFAPADSSSNDNVVGSDGANVVANNQGDGVQISGSGSILRNGVRINRIYSNTGLGINLGNDGVTANDDGDGDEGPNRLQNFPVLLSSEYDPDTEELTVTYRVPSNPGGATSQYPLTTDFYIADAENEEGRTYLGTDTYSSVDPDDYGGCGSPPCAVTTTFTPQSPVFQSDEIVATATDENRNTSEFSSSVAVEPVNDPPVANDDSTETDEGETITTDVLANDSDPDGNLEPSTVQVQSSSSDGSTTVGSGGKITYAPDTGFSGTDTYDYTVEDDDGAESNEATVTVAVNSRPTASFTFEPRVPEVGQTVTFDASGSTDEDGQIEGYRWDFGDDGQVDATGQTASTSFSTAGDKAVVLTVEDEDGATSEGSVRVTVRPGQIQVSVVRTFETRSPEDYRLVALPGQVGQALGETVSGFWRGFREEGATGSRPYSRSECDGDCEFGSGTGFWLITTQSWRVERAVQTVSLEGGDTVPLSLQDGWNIVSNPLEVDVPWEAVQEATGTRQALWQWEDGRWEEASTFQSAKEGVAYYFMDDQVSELTVPFVRTGGVSTQAEGDSTGTRESSRGKKRTLSLSVMRDQTSISSVEMGVQSGAKESLDHFDLHGPPGYFGEPTVRLTEEKETRSYTLAAEYHSPGEEGHTFDLVLRASPDTTVTLRASGAEAFAGQDVLLVDRTTGRPYNLRERPEVNVTSRSGEVRFRLLIGTSSFVEEKRREVAPTETQLLSNYPNPFREKTTIEYALPETQLVRLEVYDPLGRRVEVLVDEQQQAGFHRVRWRGRAELPSGLYFYRLRLGETTKVRKMTVVR